MERTTSINGQEYQFTATYDGDAQYHVEVRSDDQVVSTFTMAAESENELFEAAVAHFTADVELGNIKQ
ncbi:hypothetical protein ACAF76_009520 [Brevibacillus sp. TJ4]|uniref:hypothetical protein n=1 Tax=Brevibacillus sp. TJ4 TaxID=3234853 RepID=UPI003B9DF98B